MVARLFTNQRSQRFANIRLHQVIKSYNIYSIQDWAFFPNGLEVEGAWYKAVQSFLYSVLLCMAWKTVLLQHQHFPMSRVNKETNKFLVIYMK